MVRPELHRLDVLVERVAVFAGPGPQELIDG